MAGEPKLSHTAAMILQAIHAGKSPADAFVRTLRARAYLGKKDAAGAMTDHPLSISAPKE